MYSKRKIYDGRSFWWALLVHDSVPYARWKCRVPCRRLRSEIWILVLTGIRRLTGLITVLFRRRHNATGTRRLAEVANFVGNPLQATQPLLRTDILMCSSRAVDPIYSIPNENDADSGVDVEPNVMSAEPPAQVCFPCCFPYITRLFYRRTPPPPLKLTQIYPTRYQLGW